MRGHIRKRGRNSFELKFEVERTDGKRQTRFKTVRGNLRGARDELARVLAKVVDGALVESSKATVAEYLRARLQIWRAKGTVGRKAAERYSQLIENQIAPFIGSKLLQK